jgi:hypothetical protein
MKQQMRNFMSYLKGILATTLLGFVVVGVLAMVTYRDSCLDICLIDKASTVAIGGLLGAAAGALQGLIIAFFSAIGLCKRTFSCSIVSILVLVGLGVLASPQVGVGHEWAQLDLFANVAIGVVVGLFTGLSYGIGANGWKSLRTW